ncbi:Maf family nucleotide pyrophosphatase [Aestuariivirga sp.]|uniref:Maf family nucleotide pyrophosphatase n=1 Tax=Aestuariivirga sp. TaxID=2650926 RepID=UPI00359306B8
MIILASTSRTRQTILSNAGLTFTSRSPQVDERQLVAEHPEWSPAETSLNLAKAKAEDVSARFPDTCVVGADQVLALGNRVYSKPYDSDDCRRQLGELRGHTHQLISSVVCARHGACVWQVTETASLTMRTFSDTFLEGYLKTIGTDCTSSVGGYKIEGIGLQLFDSIAGDYFTILGLPLLPLFQYLRTSGEIRS